MNFSLISIKTNPPLVAHGDGLTIPQAHEEAASKALQELMTRGLGNWKFLIGKKKVFNDKNVCAPLQICKIIESLMEIITY